MTNFTGHGPVLQGCRVIELCWNLPGPYCGALLRDLGAEVIRIQSPRHPDPVQVLPSLNKRLNHGKKIKILDLQSQADREQLTSLLKTSHIMIEGFRTGVAKKLGVDFESIRTINPSIIFCSISGYGQSGSWQSMPAHDLNVQAFSGLISMPGLAGISNGGSSLPIIDFMAAKTACTRILAARLAQAQGQAQAVYIDQSMLDEAAHIVSTWGGASLPGTREGILRQLASYGVFTCLNGKKIALAITTEQGMWQKLCSLIGFDFRFYQSWDLQKRIRCQFFLRGRLALAFRCRTQETWVKQAMALGLPISPVEDYRQLETLEYFRTSSLRQVLEDELFIASALTEGRHISNYVE